VILVLMPNLVNIRLCPFAPLAWFTYCRLPLIGLALALLDLHPESESWWPRATGAEPLCYQRD